MRLTRVVGIVLILLGLTALLFKSIPYKTEKETIQIGPIQASAEEKKSIPLSPVIGVLAIGGGIVLLFVGRKR